MRKLLPLALSLALLGCKKATTPANNPTTQSQQTSQNNQPNVHASTGVVTNSNVGGGSGGAAQAIRKAAKRVANENDLKQLHLFIESASLASGQMPSLQDIDAALKKEAPNVYKLWEEKVIAVTGSKQRESIWAYTVEDQSSAGYHLVVTNQGVERMSRQVLDQRLKQQQ